MSKADLEARRRLAVRLHVRGYSIRQVAAMVGCAPSSVSRWSRAWREGGDEALAAISEQGKAIPRKLSEAQQQLLLELLLRPATDYGFSGPLWTLQKVAALIEERFGVRYHPGHLCRLLRQLGFSPQKPQVKASEQDSERVEQFRRQRWPQLGKAHGPKGAPSC